METLVAPVLDEMFLVLDLDFDLDLVAFLFFCDFPYLPTDLLRSLSVDLALAYTIVGLFELTGLLLRGL